MHPSNMKMSNEKTRKGVDLLRKTGYKMGGAKKSDASQDKKLIKKAINEHDAQLHGGKKTVLKLKDGGAASAEMPKARLDKVARGGKAKSKGGKGTKVNIVIATPPTKDQPVPVPVPVAGPRPGMPPMGPPPGAGPMPPPGLGGPGAPPPGMMKRGGGVKKAKAKKRADGGSMEDDREPIDFTGQELDAIDKRGDEFKKYMDDEGLPTTRGQATGAAAANFDMDRRGEKFVKRGYGRSQRTRDITDAFQENGDKRPTSEEALNKRYPLNRAHKSGGAAKGKKAGGPVASVPMTAGAMSGEGRLEKAALYGKKSRG